MKKKTVKQVRKVHDKMYAKEILKVTAKFTEVEAAEFLMDLVEGIEEQHKELSIEMTIDCE